MSLRTLRTVGSQSVAESLRRAVRFWEAAPQEYFQFLGRYALKNLGRSRVRQVAVSKHWFACVENLKRFSFI